MQNFQSICPQKTEVTAQNTICPFSMEGHNSGTIKGAITKFVVH